MCKRPRPGGLSCRETRAVLASLLLLLTSACTRRDEALRILPPDFEGGGARVEIRVGDDLAPSSLRIWLDGEPAEDAFAPEFGGLVAILELSSGAHRLEAQARSTGSQSAIARDQLDFVAPPPTPPLLASDPQPGADDVPRSVWIHLEFDGAIAPPSLPTFALSCNGRAREFDLHQLTPSSLVVNPFRELPESAYCLLGWRGPDGVDEIAFATAPAGLPATARYDRIDPLQLAPFPDDVWLVPDSRTRTGQRLEVPVPPFGSESEPLFEALVHDTRLLDGFSPIAPLVVEVSEAVDPRSVPLTPTESLDPLASIGLFEIAPGSPSHGQRVPFRLQLRDDATPAGLRSHNLLVFPSIPLRSQGRYALIVTRRALVARSRPLEPSLFLRRALGDPVPGEPEEVRAVRGVLAPVLEALEEGDVSPPIPREDLALALRVSVRSTEDIPDDLLAIRRQILAAPPPRLLSLSVQPEDPSQIAAGSEVAAIVEGTWEAPDWRRRRAGVAGPNLARDASGVPVPQGSRPVEFRLAIPVAALSGPVPVILHQHGNPGSQEEVVQSARAFLSQAGFAVIGFTDILNREVAPDAVDRDAAIFAQVTNIVGNLIANRTLPEHWLETTAEQIAFVRLIGNLGGLDVLPVGAPDGVPELDVGAPLSYHGISEGANTGQGLLAYAPEIEAAALVVGGARFAEVLVHQQPTLFVDSLSGLFPGATPAHIWSALALFQTIFDVQDSHNHLEFVHRRPLLGDGGSRKPSVLLIEGLDDSFVPNHATHSAAFALGPIPHLAPVQRPVPFLEVVRAPVQANVDARTSAALFQYAPRNLPGIPPTPGCGPPEMSEDIADEGHFCAQGARESQLQRAIFFQTAVADQAPTIVDPFPLFE